MAGGSVGPVGVVLLLLPPPQALTVSPTTARTRAKRTTRSNDLPEVHVTENPSPVGLHETRDHGAGLGTERIPKQVLRFVCDLEPDDALVPLDLLVQNLHLLRWAASTGLRLRRAAPRASHTPAVAAVAARGAAIGRVGSWTSHEAARRQLDLPAKVVDAAHVAAQGSEIRRCGVRTPCVHGSSRSCVDCGVESDRVTDVLRHQLERCQRNEQVEPVESVRGAQNFCKRSGTHRADFTCHVAADAL